ncbi:MAG: beta-ketoacyl-[acyl-carrier-protein] synthase family protein [Planctomycetes bacterium]|nr:beta-ketoacyl-[acyl-carrier-protein] synthase family protein [Planctomycetota bacterium]
MSRRIVITGLGAVTPAGVGAAALAAAVREGRSAVGPITRFDASRHPSRVAGQAPDFDPSEGVRKEQGRYIKKNIKVMALDIQLAVAAVNLAVLDSGLPPGDPKAGQAVLPTIDHARLGMVFGTSFIPTELDDLAAPIQAAQGADGQFTLKGWGERGIAQMFPLWLLKYLPNMHACHAGILWDAQGPSNSLTTSDAGGLLAVDEAARIIRRGHADWMLAGGAESRVHPVLVLRYCLANRLATANSIPAAACRPFDLDRTGAVAAEGAAAVMLEAADVAEKRGARIYGEVLGTGAGTTTAGINACDADGRAVATAVRRALAAAAVQPADLGAIVAHGTAFAPQDSSEAAGLRAALGPAAETVPVTAIKGVTGNMGAAGGAAELVVALLLLGGGRVPPILNCSRPDPAAGLNLVVGRAAPLRSDLVLVTSNAVGGQAAAAVVRIKK